MRKTALILALALLSATATALQFPEDGELVTGEVNSSPPMPGDNFSVETSKTGEDQANSSSANSSTQEEVREALEDDSGEQGVISSILESIKGFVPFL